MVDNTEVRHQSRLRTLYYWIALFAILVVVDDLTFGWIFWLLAQIHPLVSATAALLIYWVLGYWLLIRGLNPNPGKWAHKMLNRLQLERKNPELRAREEELKNKITSVAVAIPMSLLFGGVLTVLWLRRRNVVSDDGAYRLGFWLCGLYALEFALLHGFGIGGSIFIIRQ